MNRLRNIHLCLGLNKIVLNMLLASLSISWSALAVSENLYSDQDYKSHVSDDIAYKIGDVVTLIIIETSEAKSGTNDNFNTEFGIAGNFSKPSRNESIGLSADIDSANSELTERVGRLQAQMSVEVVEIDVSGKFRVAGEQSIVINGEEQLITVSGWLRQKDIGRDNTTISSRLSDADIRYTGHRKNEKRRGLFRRVFSWLGL